MNIGKELAEFRARFPECAKVVYADLSTRMVLASETEQPTTQEVLDRLCADAIALMECKAAAEVARRFAACDDDRPLVGVWAIRGELKCVLRARPPVEEALCLVVVGGTGIAKMVPPALEMLDRVSADA